MIFSVLGTPNESDMDFVTDNKAVEYLKSFPTKRAIDFKELYPSSLPESIDFLNRTIAFNPKKRMTVD
jgi:mitogen-activated protein kinase 1/3